MLVYNYLIRTPSALALLYTNRAHREEKRDGLQKQRQIGRCLTVEGTSPRVANAARRDAARAVRLQTEPPGRRRHPRD